MINQIKAILSSNKPRDALPLLNTLTNKNDQNLYVDTEIVKDTILVAVMSRIYTILQIKFETTNLNEQDKRYSNNSSNYNNKSNNNNSNNYNNNSKTTIVSDNINCNVIPFCILETLNKEDKNLRFFAEYFFDNLENENTEKIIRMVVENIINDYENETFTEINTDTNANTNTNTSTNTNLNTDTNLNTNTSINTNNNTNTNLNTNLTLIDDVSYKELSTFENTLSKLFKTSKPHNKINAVKRKAKILQNLFIKHKTRDLKIMSDLLYISEILKEKNNRKKVKKTENVEPQCKLLKFYFTNLKNPQKINKYFLHNLKNYDAFMYVNLVMKKCEEYKIKFKYSKFLKACKQRKELCYIDPAKIPFKYLVRVSYKKRYEKLVKSAVRKSSEKELVDGLQALKKIEMKHGNEYVERIMDYIKKRLERMRSEKYIEEDKHVL